MLIAAIYLKIIFIPNVIAAFKAVRQPGEISFCYLCRPVKLAMQTD